MGQQNTPSIYRLKGWKTMLDRIKTDLIDRAQAIIAALIRTEAEAALSGGGEDGCIDTH